MGKKQQAKKAKKEFIENQFKTNGTRRTIESDLLSDTEMLRQVKANNRVCWGLTNMVMALQLNNESALERILDGFRKYGYRGQEIENIARCFRKMKFVNNETVEALKHCYKESLLQATTVGNLMIIFNELIGTTIGLNMGGDYCSSEYELAYIPKTLVPAIKLAPGGDKIDWVNEKVEQMCKEGNDYLDRHDLQGNDVEFRVDKANKIKTA